MKSNLTNKYIAEKLGWEPSPAGEGIWFTGDETRGQKGLLYLLNFLKDLNAIVYEIEKRGTECHNYCYEHVLNDCDGHWAIWEPEYLCRALVNYIDKKNLENYKKE